jgi:hypothetical protein
LKRKLGAVSQGEAIVIPAARAANVTIGASTSVHTP